MSMKFSIDPVITDELVQQFAAQLEELDDRDVTTARIEKLFAGDRDKQFYEGLLTGYANAYYMVQHSGGRTGPELGRVVVFVASKVRTLRPLRLALHRRRRLVAVGGREISLSPADFAFYALLARRRQKDGDGFVAWDTPDLVRAYLEEYRGTMDETNGTFDRVRKALHATAGDGDSLRTWFEERKSRVNRAFREEGGAELARLYGIAKKGSRPNVRSGLDLDPAAIDIRD